MTKLTKEDHMQHLSALNDAGMPDFFAELDDDKASQLRGFVDGVLEQNDAGVNKMFESFAIFVKYIPNFLIHSIGPKYTEPQVAARLSTVLPPKQAGSLAGGFPMEYMGETSRYMKPDKAAEIMPYLSKKVQNQLIDYSYQNYPQKALDIASFLDKKLFKHVAGRINPATLDKLDLSPSQRETLDRLKSV